MNQDQELLAVGRIVKPFGLRGEVVVECLADSVQRFRTVREVLLGPTPATTRPAEVTRAVIERRGVRLTIAGVGDRTAAEGLVGQYLFVDPLHRARLPRGRHFIHQVVGLTVLDQHGAVVGRVREVLKLPAQDLFVIERHGQEIMIPAVEEFIRSIEPEMGICRVHLIEGMVQE